MYGAERNVELSLGVEAPAEVTRIVAALTQQGYSVADIARMPPWELDRLDDQFGLMES